MMSWMTPMAAIVAGAVTIPLLVLLYFLKLKRREVSVSSTLLWKRAIQDLQVNAPFQKIRKNILLLLQMLALLSLVVILGTPMIATRGGAAKHYVILIDRSGSMSATDVLPSRLDKAKELAKEFVGTLRQNHFFSSGADQAMVIAFGDEPQVVCPFVSDRNRLLTAIDSIEPGDGGTNLGETIRIARAFATQTDSDAMGRSAVTPAKLVMFTDGKILEPEKITMHKDEMTVYQVGQGTENVAITALEARRSFEDPEQVSVFVNLTNYSEKAGQCDLELRLDQKLLDVQHVKLPAGVLKQGEKQRGGQVGVTFNLRLASGGILEVRKVSSTADLLSADDRAWAVVTPPRRLSVLLVGPGNLVLEEAMRALPLAKMKTVNGQEYDAMDQKAFDAGGAYDVVVLDRVSPKRYFRCGYLSFGAGPMLKGLKVDGPREDQFILDWRASHAALRYVNLENIYAGRWWNYELPEDAEILAESDKGAVMAMLTRSGSRYLMVNFDLLSSNWPFKPGFVMFLYNAINMLGNAADDASEYALKVGSTFNLKLPADSKNAFIIRPDGKISKRTTDTGGILRYAPLDKVGIYGVQAGKEIDKRFVVNMLDPAESDIVPSGKLTFAGETVKLQNTSVISENLDLRPWILIFAIVVLCVEWFIYNKKVQI
jgi:hypothetical protein